MEKIDLQKVIIECEADGYKVKVRDIAYVVLCRTFDDCTIAYQIVFGNGDVDAYKKSTPIKYLTSYIDNKYPDEPKKVKKKDSDDDITFEENKADMVKLIKKTQAELAAGNIESKDALKIEADLRIKLNDKFQVKEDVKDQIVHVNFKYDDICPYCSHEIARRPISKMEAMGMYNLVEKN